MARIDCVETQGNVFGWIYSENRAPTIEECQDWFKLRLARKVAEHTWSVSKTDEFNRIEEIQLKTLTGQILQTLRLFI